MPDSAGLPDGHYPPAFIGAETSRICSQNLSPNPNLYKFVKSIHGSDVQAGEEVDLQSYVCTKGLIVMEETDSGASHVGSLMKSQ